MNITNVKLTRLSASKTLALANITIDQDFVVSGLKVLNGKNGLWVAMPNRKDSKGEYHDIAFPITKEARETIQSSVLNKYNEPQQDNFVPDYTESAQDREKVREDITSDDLPF